jgi:molecular chaperone Hsp33
VRVQASVPLARGCRCSTIHFEEVLARFPKEDRRDMRDENGIILVDCAFCSREFPIQD